MLLNLRLFTVEGIEVFADDIQYQKHDIVLYVSCNGEEYDTSTGFKQYEMLHKLGSGGFGTVLLARHRFTKKKFAIKIVNTASAGTAEILIWCSVKPKC
jgi:serine/threonine protein kinase